MPRTETGYVKWHNERVVTVFSASNYCNRTGNMGSVAILSNPPNPETDPPVIELKGHWVPDWVNFSNVMQQLTDESDAAEAKLRQAVDKFEREQPRKTLEAQIQRNLQKDLRRAVMSLVLR